MSLTVEQILAVDESPVQEVPTPEWKGSVYVRRLSALDALALAGSIRKITAEDETTRAQEGLIAGLMAYLCDESGNSLVSTSDQARQIARKSAYVVNRIVAAGHALNSVDDSGLKAAEKN